MLVMCVDLETTGLEPSIDEIIEIGAVLWDTERKLPVRLYSEMINISPLKIDSNISNLTKITNADLLSLGVSLEEALDGLNRLASRAKAIVGHNILQFDKIFLDIASYKVNIPPIDIPVIDTFYDVPFAPEIKVKKLNYLASEHGFLNPFSHRAVFDALTTMKIVSSYNFDEVWQTAQSPLVEVIASVSYQNRSLAKTLGFKWSDANKTWSRFMREESLNRIQLPFEYKIERNR